MSNTTNVLNNTTNVLNPLPIKTINLRSLSLSALYPRPLPSFLLARTLWLAARTGLFGKNQVQILPHNATNFSVTHIDFCLFDIVALQKRKSRENQIESTKRQFF